MQFLEIRHRLSRRRILVGTYVLSAGYYDAYYRKAQQVRSLIREDFRRAKTLWRFSSAPIASPKAITLSTAAALRTGRAPGIARQTGQV